MKEDYFPLKKLYGNKEDVWEEIQLLDRWRIEQLDKETKLQAELRRVHVQYGETCRSLNILEEKVYQLVKQMERLNEEPEHVRDNHK